MKNKTIFNLICALCIFGATGYAVYFAIDIMTTKIETVHEARLKESQIRSHEFGNKIRQDLDALTVHEQKIKNSFIPLDQLLGFIQRLEESASVRNLDITIERVDQGTAEKIASQEVSVAPVSFSLQLRGSYFDISNFVAEVLEYEKKLTLKQISFHGSGAEDQAGYTARLTLSGNIISYE